MCVLTARRPSALAAQVFGRIASNPRRPHQTHSPSNKRTGGIALPDPGPTDRPSLCWDCCNPSSRHRNRKNSMAPHQKHSCSALAVVAAVLIGLATGAHAAPVARGLDLCQSYTRVCNDFTSQVGMCACLPRRQVFSWLTDPLM